ncbi:MAG TPA: GNAT family N-acetyltransferase [Thermoanaerobacterales bacterium]|nr:GNAT family N-acetyltransferase [Thermoanaerobacterales bacterium]
MTEQDFFIKGTWEELEKHDHITPFSTYAWASNWIKIWGKKVYTPIVKNSELVIGLAPFIQTMGKLRFIGYNNCDYLGFLYKPGLENEFFEGLADQLLEKNILLLDLEHLPEKYCSIKIKGYEKTCMKQDVCPHIILPDNWDAYMSSLNKRFRKNIEYSQRRLNREYSVKYELVSKEQDVKPTLLKMIKMHQERWRSKKLPGAFYSKKIVRFHLNLAEDLFLKKYLDLHRLIINDEIAAVLYGFHKGKSTYYYLSGFDDKFKNLSIGVILTLLAIKTSIDRKDTVFDFLRGNESYKYNFCNAKKYNYRLVFHRGYFAGLRSKIIKKENSLIGAVKAHFEN